MYWSSTFIQGQVPGSSFFLVFSLAVLDVSFTSSKTREESTVHVPSDVQHDSVLVFMLTPSMLSVAGFEGSEVKSSEIFYSDRGVAL